MAGLALGVRGVIDVAHNSSGPLVDIYADGFNFGQDGSVFRQQNAGAIVVELPHIGTWKQVAANVKNKNQAQLGVPAFPQAEVSCIMGRNEDLRNNSGP